ncbi:hypothetical protein AB1N83_012393 [Pleurotus pulmonarius]|nr:hypothetical protein EYR38_003178 [Pleurotus pulmonarius]
MQYASNPPFVLDYHNLHLLQFTAANILIETYAAGSIHLMNDEILRCRIEYHLGWYPDSLDTPHGRMVVSQTRFLIMSYFHAAATSVAIRFAILGIALESIRLYLEL